jgi:fumarate reductase subunit C
MNLSLYMCQRATAALMAPMVLVHLVLVHLAVIFYATRHGLTAADILGRVRGSVGWGGFYALFVVAISIHAGIGVRNILAEWSSLAERTAGFAAAALGLFLLGLGLRAVAAVALP